MQFQSGLGGLTALSMGEAMASLLIVRQNSTEQKQDAIKFAKEYADKQAEATIEAAEKQAEASRDEAAGAISAAGLSAASSGTSATAAVRASRAADMNSQRLSKIGELESKLKTSPESSGTLVQAGEATPTIEGPVKEVMDLLHGKNGQDISESVKIFDKTHEEFHAKDGMADHIHVGSKLGGYEDTSKRLSDLKDHQSRELSRNQDEARNVLTKAQMLEGLFHGAATGAAKMSAADAQEKQGEAEARRTRYAFFLENMKSVIDGITQVTSSVDQQINGMIQGLSTVFQAEHRA